VVSSPYKFKAPWNSWEFAYHVLRKKTNLVVMSMAWSTHADPLLFHRISEDPDMESLTYWLARLEPLIRENSEGEVIVVLCNRTGVEEDTVYVGTSCVLGICKGKVKVYGILGRGEKELLIVDTNNHPQTDLVFQINPAYSNASEAFPEGATLPSNSDAPAPTVDTAYRSADAQDGSR
jgi:protein N-terminal amidase